MMTKTAFEDGDDLVHQYLIQNPDFLQRHPHLLETLAMPSYWGKETGVIDIQHHIVERLKDQLDQLKLCAQEWVENTSANMIILNRIHEAALTIIACADCENLTQVVQTKLPPILNVDVIRLAFLAPEDTLDLKSFFGTQTLLLRSQSQHETWIYGSQEAPLIQSDALMPITLCAAPLGVLAIGSYQFGEFNHHQQGDLLIFLSKVLTQCLLRFLPQI